MSIDRIVRVNELLKREIAEQLVKLLDNTALNPATVMISRVETSSDLKYANVFVSVIGEPDYQEEALGVVEAQRNELQRVINKESRFKFTPRLSFFLDHSIEKGNHVLEIIADMEQEHPEWSEEGKKDE